MEFDRQIWPQTNTSHFGGGGGGGVAAAAAAADDDDDDVVTWPCMFP